LINGKAVLAIQPEQNDGSLLQSGLAFVSAIKRNYTKDTKVDLLKANVDQL